jgi:hypothetical protein
MLKECDIPKIIAPGPHTGEGTKFKNALLQGGLPNVKHPS